jgi:hypothetical protein
MIHLGDKYIYNIFLEFGINVKPFRPIKICLNKTYNEICIGKYLSGAFHIWNVLKQGDALSPLLFNFAVEYTSRKVQESKQGLELNGTLQLLVDADGVDLLCESTHYRETEALVRC